MRACLVLGAQAVVAAVALAPSAGAVPASYPSVYHLVAHVTSPDGSATGTFTATLVPRGGSATLRWRITYTGVSDSASAVLRTTASGTTPAAALRLCPPPACYPGVQGTYLRTKVGSPFYRGLVHGRGLVELRTATVTLRGTVMVAQAVA